MKINWKIVAATITSLLAMLAALPYTMGDVATIIPPEWKAKVFMVSAIATVVLRLWNTSMGVQVPPPPSQININQAAPPQEPKP